MSELTGEPILSLWLTQRELKLAYAYAFVAAYHPAYGLEDAEEDREAVKEDLGLALLWAIGELGTRYRMPFRGLEVNDKGQVTLTSEEPVEPRNIVYVERFQMGKGPHYIALFRDALEYAEALGLPARGLDTEPIREFLAGAIRDVEAIQKQMTDEERQEIDKAMEDTLKSAGIRVLDGPSKYLH